MTTRAQQSAVLAFWFRPGMEKCWFSSTDALDREIRSRFEPVWRLARDGQLADWEDTAEGALALVIVLDHAYRQASGF